MIVKIKSEKDIPNVRAIKQTEFEKPKEKQQKNKKQNFIKIL